MDLNHLVQINPDDIKVIIVYDKPKSGMWHCGPNASWIEVIHIPTKMSVRIFSYGSQWKAREKALTLLEMMLEDLDEGDYPQFPENIQI